MNQDFRRSFLETYPNIEEFDATTALEISLAKAKEGIFRLSSTFDNLKLLIEWNESLTMARNLASFNYFPSDSIPIEKSGFIESLRNICENLKVDTKEGQAGIYANYLRTLGLLYGLLNETKMYEGGQSHKKFENELHESLIDYAVSIAKRNNISFNDRMNALMEAALALLDMRKMTPEISWASREQPFLSIVDHLWSENNQKADLPAEQLHRQYKYYLLRYVIGTEIWTGSKIPPVDKQPEPKPYKIALQQFRSIVKEVLDLLANDQVGDQEVVQLELVALETQSWVSQLIQDMGIVFSNDFTFEDARLEKDRLLEIRLRVENNPAQFSNRSFDLIQKARLHEIEFYQYQYTPESLQKSIQLINAYVPEILPPLDEAIPPPEGRFDIRCGVGMLVWKAEAYDQLKQLDRAEQLFQIIRHYFGDRYRYPDPWCFSFDKFAQRYLQVIPKKREEMKRGR
ncbi:MAG: hypothetical protein C4527_23910 [Candidatus Omnitrophota bacterium]|nr:MAG: hypothetical protein C4527_23910 [Candidatus Omnitrophota bacterium]